jgi:spore maturation protein CgeB
MEALLDRGHHIIPVDSRPFSAAKGIMFRILRRLHLGPPMLSYNQLLLRTVEEEQPNVVWVDSGAWILRETLAKIRATSGALLIHYTPDAALVFNRIAHPTRSRHFRRAIPEYDLLVTTKSYEMNDYIRSGARKLLLQPPTFDRRLHKPEQPTDEEKDMYACDVVFIGTYGVGRERFLAPLARSGVDLAIWGNNWQRCRDPELRRLWKGRGLNGRDYSVALCCSKIGLGLLSPLVPDQTTTRTMEIPACGTFLLAQRTPEHLELFKESVEAEFFSSFEELLSKVRTYLNDPVTRNRVAVAGRQRCLNSRYSSSERVADIILEVQLMLDRRTRKSRKVPGS